MAYQTRSDTLKLQRLIDILKERGSETATNLEISATDFLNDVKVSWKKKPRFKILLKLGCSLVKLGYFRSLRALTLNQIT